MKVEPWQTMAVLLLAAYVAVPVAGDCLCDVSASVAYPGMQRIDCSFLSLVQVPADCLTNSLNISELLLSHNGLTDIRSTTLAELTELRELRLDNNQLSFIDVTAFEFMTELKVLALDHNLNLALESAVFSYLVSLEELTTIGTNLRYLPDITNLAHLKKLDVRSSNLVTLPVHMFNDQLAAPSMYVSIQGNKIPDAAVNSFLGLPDDTIFYVDTEPQLMFWAHNVTERDAFIAKPWRVNFDLPGSTVMCDVDGLPGDLTICYG
ncbi:hypothetical protein HAZT_HAZT004299 [Hyalella azteca]|uniref:Leucine-rich repeat-containing G-protein coupled receptor 4 n=1 Tax=Hyalella azteca TaxID=294128 RepID=A0A6A0H432_HYAAZ|nr:leucine-rich repeat-containing G-protein coupled receptor 4 [Hyalella azteca]KAA0196662.1 hypothetical protein HAZT_HAZT004299 [Hyalella azteca]